jgi:anti-anti-sigma regulatory factor
MLKITTRHEAGTLVFQLEGKLAGPWVQELERCWRSVTGTRQSRVDLSSVTFIDADGKALLGQMHREGAELVASGCLNKCIVEGIIHSEEKQT